MAPIALLSQVIPFSPDAGLRKVGAVVVVAGGKVVTAGAATEVEGALSTDFVAHAARPTRRGRSSRAFFTGLLCQRFSISP
jgi:hypothetical protein